MDRSVVAPVDVVVVLYGVIMNTYKRLLCTSTYIHSWKGRAAEKEGGCRGGERRSER